MPGKQKNQTRKSYPCNLKISSDEKFKNENIKESSNEKDLLLNLQEDELQIDLTNTQIHKNWNTVSKKISKRTGASRKMRGEKIKKGQWSLKEDKLLKEWIRMNGPKKWEECGRFINGRSGKQCREHWNNCLNPDLIKGYWTAEEDFLILQFYEECNGSWKNIINLLNGRNENSIKNRFFSELRKIAAKYITIPEKKSYTKYKLDQLKVFLNEGISEAKKRFLSEKKMTEEELNDYLNEKNEYIKKKICEQNSNFSLDKSLSTNYQVSESTEESDKSFLKKRSRSTDESSEENSISKNHKTNIFITEYKDLNKFRENCINLQEKNEINKLYISISSTYDNKDENLKMNDKNDIISLNENNEDNLNNVENDNFLSFTTSFPINNNIFIGELDYQYKPSYEFLNNNRCHIVNSNGNLLIADNSNLSDINVKLNNDILYEKEDEDEQSYSFVEEIKETMPLLDI